MMLPDSFAVESAWGDRWSLVGSVTMRAQVLPTGGSLRLTRRNDFLSLRIRKAMIEGSVLPAVHLTTPGGDVKLVNARVMSVTHAGVNDRPQHENAGSGEFLVVSFTFQKIVWINKGGKKDWTDDWSAGG
jgi:hypothetical protein